MLRGKHFIIALVTSISLALSAPKTFVYILKFENIERDESVDWLARGFVDMLNAQLEKVDGVALKNRQDLEVVMDNRNLLLHQPRGSKNMLLLGKYKRALDEIKINLQLVDIATWEEADRRKISGTYNEVPQLNKRLTEAVQTMLKPFLPEKKPSKYPALLTPESKPVDGSYSKGAREVTEGIATAFEELETSLDLITGARGKVETPIFSEREGEWTMDFGTEHAGPHSPENLANTDMLIGILDRLMTDPYEVTLERPEFIYNEEHARKMTVVFPVNFAIKGDVIKDMLMSLPYSGLKQDGSLTIFFFDKDKFTVPGELSKRIKFGKYRAVPVIRFYDEKGKVVVLIVDTPETVWHTASSRKVHWVPEHRFSPLIDFTVGGWSMQVALEAVNIPVNYSFTLDVDQAQRLQRVSLKFIPEHELESFLRPYL